MIIDNHRAIVENLGLPHYVQLLYLSGGRRSLSLTIGHQKINYNIKPNMKMRSEQGKFSLV